MKQGCPIIASSQQSIGSPSHSNQTRKTKGIQTGREEVKLSLYSDDLTLYTENPKDSAQKFLELINKFSNVVEYKTDVLKSVTFLYINSETSERECKQIIPFKMHQTKFRTKPDQGSERPIC